MRRIGDGNGQQMRWRKRWLAATARCGGIWRGFLALEVQLGGASLARQISSRRGWWHQPITSHGKSGPFHNSLRIPTRFDIKESLSHMQCFLRDFHDDLLLNIRGLHALRSVLKVCPYSSTTGHYAYLRTYSRTSAHDTASRVVCWLCNDHRSSHTPLGAPYAW